ncbi:PREDICTED: probable protein phosphatase 2C 74 [Ipomoea nil]|uniref:probable protein phosphatase 2C 74 n=1 Tax=Ipomoea nil TaxID=35883 RepID=UPI000900C407|nr:PREDICTED: probable protein phosphatase 2C 74 [Ipomoea nil]
MMIIFAQQFITRFSIILSLVLNLLHRLRKAAAAAHMSSAAAISSPSPMPQSSPSSSSSSSSLRCGGVRENGGSFLPSRKQPAAAISRKRPALLQVPVYSPESDFAVFARKRFEDIRSEMEVEGRDYFVASKKGRREVMEDGHSVILDILGDSKQAFFVVIDGHGGRNAVDYVAENLGKNIVNSLEAGNKVSLSSSSGNHIEDALRQGYSETDKQFLVQGKDGGACAASVLIKDGEMHVANVGDCGVVLSRKSVAVSLTSDHRPASREDERARIEKSGGMLYCQNGVLRVNGSLAVSRAFGDHHLKELIISEPDILNLPLTSDCQFLILASDGLWDKVSNQEAVDVVLSENNSMKSCKKLVDLSSMRGSLDDVTVMVINLQNFLMSNST